MRTLFVANRGEIARRIMRTAGELGLGTAVPFTAVDTGAPHVLQADVAVPVGSYLDVAGVVAAARRAGADAVHPGYGFLSENATFAAAVLAAGLTWVGPAPETIRVMGDKVEAKARLAAAGVPGLPGGGPEVVAAVGFPLLVKAAAGGGGKGMRLVGTAGQLEEALEAAGREAASSFGDGTVFIERWLAAPRHVEVQIFGDSHGRVIHLGERECSIQRRHQKVIEETPAPGVSDALRQRILAAAVAGAEAIGYQNAGTMEFLVDGEDFFFLEMNTRLQVEHPVTEAVTGLDLVRWQLVVAEGGSLPPQAQVVTNGHAIEARVYAEDPANGFLPSPGTVARWRVGPTEGIRYDAGVADGTVVSPDYDPMMAKVVAWAQTRAEASARLARALRELQVHGVRTNLEMLAGVLSDDDFLAGRTTTDFLDRHPALLATRPPPPVHLLAAVAATSSGRRRTAPVLGFAPSGWRNVGAEPQHVSFSAEGQLDRLDIDYRWSATGHLSADVAGSALQAAVTVAADGASVDVEHDGVRRRCDVHQLGDQVWVNSGLGQSGFRELPRFAEAATGAAGHGPTAPLPGTVVAVAVAEGDRVEPGTLLVVLEAMKMEHRIVAATDSVVAQVRVAVGDRVDAGHVLVVLG